MQNILTIVQAHWVIISAILYGLSAGVASLITALTNYPKTEGVLHVIQGVLSWMEHADVKGFKLPFKTLSKPTIGSSVSPKAGENTPTKP